MTLNEIREKFMLNADYHTHTVYSRMGPYLHGKGSIIQNAAVAAAKGLRELGITDHGPYDFYGLSIKRIPEMRRDIDEAAAAYPELSLYLGVEADIVDTENGLDVTREEQELFDFVNAGYHYVPHSCMIRNWMAFHLPELRLKSGGRSETGNGSPAGVSRDAGWREKLRRRNTERIVKALHSNTIKILTHPGDKALINEHAVARACEETGTLIEINARHRHPDAADLKIYAGYDVKFVISSDAHKPCKVGRFDESLRLAFEAGISPERIINIERRGQQDGADSSPVTGITSDVVRKLR